LHFAGDAIMTDTEAFCAALARAGLGHDPEKRALGPDPGGGDRFSEKIMPKTKDKRRV
jgi:hypothetical protein